MQGNGVHDLRKEIRNVERVMREKMRSVLAIEVLGFDVLVAVGGR